MTSHLREQLSALADGELGPSEARFMLRSLDGDGAAASELRGAWSRYHVIRSSLRREPHAAAGASEAFVAGVMAKLADETIVVAPVAGRAPRRWLRPVAGGLVAASVAAAALVLSMPQPQQPAAPAAAVATVPPSTVVETGLRGSDLAPRLEVQTVSDRRVALPQATPIGDVRFQGYLIRHGDATAVGPRAIAPFVYAVSAPAPQRAARADTAR
jgi:sigma-E factor negative regulatory protein RseA